MMRLSDGESGENAENGDNEEEGGDFEHLYPYDDACSELEYKLKKTDTGSIIWSLSSIFVRGKILYAPENTYTNKIILQVRKTSTILSRSDFNYCLYRQINLPNPRLSF